MAQNSKTASMPASVQPKKKDKTKVRSPAARTATFMLRFQGFEPIVLDEIGIGKAIAPEQVLFLLIQFDLAPEGGRAHRRRCETGFRLKVAEDCFRSNMSCMKWRCFLHLMIKICKPSEIYTVTLDRNDE